MPAAMKKLCLAACLLLSGFAAQAQEDRTYRFYGYAYDRQSNGYLYTEVHAQTVVDGRWSHGTIRYYAPDGSLLGSKTLDYSQNPYIPVYRMELPQQQYSEAIVSVKDGVRMEHSDKGESAGKTLPLQPLMAADSGFHSLILDRFQELLDGKPLPFNFGVAGKLDVYKFRIRRIDDGSFEGQPTRRFLVEADSMLRLVAPSLELSYDTDGKRLLEYRGISNIRDPATGKGYATRIAYYDEPPADAPRPLPPLE